ncbi:glycoside hydrolase family 97 protein [Ferruginibacter sp. SUN002]|uniref:glycoside hydrolase family 97 protein n=1 Tax=Ferruginibacter sp. SUN002 TaxID=2937789 RepID=UPI003D35F061
MTIKQYISLFFTCWILNAACAQKEYTINFQKIKLTFNLNTEGTPVYQVTYGSKDIIQPSSLGFKLVDHTPLNNAFEIVGVDSSIFDEIWKPVLGEVSKIRNHYKQLLVHLKQKRTGYLLDIAFRVFNDGVGFRYQFPKQNNLKYFIVADEETQFNLAGDHKAFWIPGDYDSNEYEYTESKLSEVDSRSIVASSTDICVRTVKDFSSVQTPLMMKTADGLYINIHEAAQINYPAMQLHVDKNTNQLSSSLVPDAVGNKAYLHAPFNTPWRTIIVSDKATDILASKMILNLNEPSVIKNTSWIKSMKFVGVWWEMQTGKGGWNYANHADSLNAKGQLVPNGRHSATTANVKRYIDFAAANKIQGVLVEGWNVGWEDWFGTWKEQVFDFVTPYPDFNVKELQNYAAKKGVQIIMHNETASSATAYDRSMDTAFKFMKKFGYKSVKTGYVGKVVPRGEFHDGQWMNNHYLRVAKKAVDYQIMVDAHEPVRPTGLNRTYPNWVASEAGRGNEYFAFSHGNPVNHETILPFTRLMGGAMDYTPGIFKLNHYAAADTTRRLRSTLCKQLALYVTLYSPLQMAADLPENYEAHKDAFKFISDVPTDWDDTKILEAEPGDYVAIARKGKGTNNWFIGAITGENSREINVDLSFLDKNKKYAAVVYADAPGTDYLNNQEGYVIKKINLTRESTLTLNLGKGGGAAVSIIQL